MEPQISALNTLRTAIAMLLWLTLLTGLVYPALVTGIGNLIFSGKAKGSLIMKDGKVMGSRLIGQQMDDPAYFWGRPSATSPFPYNAAASSGSNLGPTNPALMQRIQERMVALNKEAGGNSHNIPVDIVTASGSGLDPHISQAAAYWQSPRIARLRGLTEPQLHQLIERHTTYRFLNLLGEPVVNVLEINIALDQIAHAQPDTKSAG